MAKASAFATNRSKAIVILNMPYHALKDFTAVTHMAVAQNIVTAHPSFAAHSIRELVAAARAKPAGSPKVALCPREHDTNRPIAGRHSYDGILSSILLVASTLTA
jgi:hypothetical protein